VQRAKDAEAELKGMGLRVVYRWVKSHRGNQGNGYADDLARLGAERSIAGEYEENGWFFDQEEMDDMLWVWKRNPPGQFAEALKECPSKEDYRKKKEARQRAQEAQATTAEGATIAGHSDQ